MEQILLFFQVGQEDLLKCIKAGGLEQLQMKNIALGISTRKYSCSYKLSTGNSWLT